ncbi:hypothetical protein LWI29_007064 [Acer saccharum]|uniref:PGG domain-containing protein n=1 Tax=Acer saccharum TaxID=4024 RepID=A0AA39VDS6_ACESA|nr:hypothetical protein LWI29_007064 [Acer saccharum]
MDQRLYAAACKGDVEALLELLREDPLILFTATLSTSDTPLHIAALLGHNEFAKLAMTHNPKLSTEFNRYGYSPIHVASLKGHLQIVKDLLNIDEELCVLRDNCEGRTALHCAAIKGRIDVIRHLLSCRPESAKELTFKGETILHLVVKNRQGVQIMKPLISILGEPILVEDLINCVDEDGNTVLHLATYTNQYQIIKVLLRDTNVNVNAVNADGFNASAISEMNNNASSSEFDNKNTIGEMIKQAQSLQRGGSSDQAHGVLITTTNANSGRNEEQIVDVVNSHGAAATAKAILNLPGGIDREQLQSNPMKITADQLNEVRSFLVFDAGCFFISVTTIFVVTTLPYIPSVYWLHFNLLAAGAVIGSAGLLFQNVLVLATNDHLADVAIKGGLVSSVSTIVVAIIVRLLISKKFWSVIGKACSKRRDLDT